MAREEVLNQILVELREIKVSVREIDEDLHREVRPEYIEKLKKIEKEGYGPAFRSIEELRKKIVSQ